MKKKTKSAHNKERDQILKHMELLLELLDCHFPNLKIEFVFSSKKSAHNKKKTRSPISKKELKKAYVQANEDPEDDGWEREHSDRMVDDNLNEADN